MDGNNSESRDCYDGPNSIISIPPSRTVSNKQSRHCSELEILSWAIAWEDRRFFGRHLAHSAPFPPYSSPMMKEEYCCLACTDLQLPPETLFFSDTISEFRFYTFAGLLAETMWRLRPRFAAKPLASSSVSTDYLVLRNLRRKSSCHLPGTRWKTLHRARYCSSFVHSLREMENKYKVPYIWSLQTLKFDYFLPEHCHSGYPYIFWTVQSPYLQTLVL